MVEGSSNVMNETGQESNLGRIGNVIRSLLFTIYYLFGKQTDIYDFQNFYICFVQIVKTLFMSTFHKSSHIYKSLDK